MAGSANSGTPCKIQRQGITTESSKVRITAARQEQEKCKLNSKLKSQNQPIKQQSLRSDAVKGDHSERTDDSSKILNCPTHTKKCSMKEVRKEGNNRGRWFFSCPVRTCNYFEVKCYLMSSA